MHARCCFVRDVQIQSQTIVAVQILLFCALSSRHTIFKLETSFDCDNKYNTAQYLPQNHSQMSYFCSKYWQLSHCHKPILKVIIFATMSTDGAIVAIKPLSNCDNRY